MNRLYDKDGITTTLSALRFLSVRLKSRPETAPLEAGVSHARQSLQQADERWQQAHEERCGATAEIEYLDTELDEAVAELAREITVVVKNDRSDPRHKKLFAVPPTTGMAGRANDSQERYVANIMGRLAEDQDYAAQRKYLDTIGKHQAALKASVQRREALYVPESQALADRTIALDHARRVYNQMGAQLTLLFNDKRTLVDSFFVANSRKRKSADVVDDTGKSPSDE